MATMSESERRAKERRLSDLNRQIGVLQSQAAGLGGELDSAANDIAQELRGEFGRGLDGLVSKLEALSGRLDSLETEARPAIENLFKAVEFGTKEFQGLEQRVDAIEAKVGVAPAEVAG